MIITRLTLKNFGVYAGINTFDFKNLKPVVLIGGMNGRGRQHFLKRSCWHYMVPILLHITRVNTIHMGNI